MKTELNVGIGLPPMRLQKMKPFNRNSSAPASALWLLTVFHLDRIAVSRPFLQDYNIRFIRFTSQLQSNNISVCLISISH